MIIGKGSIASMLNDREGFVFFAAGVGDSKCLDVSEYMKEVDRVFDLAENHYEMFVYFSSISIFTTKTPYTYHKQLMEKHIKNMFLNSCIIRLGNVWECTNPNTFINAYKNKPYEPREEYKYMISKKQLNLITDNLPRTGQHEISIFGELLSVKECLNRIK